jgi:hypothetical protein
MASMGYGGSPHGFDGLRGEPAWLRWATGGARMASMGYLPTGTHALWHTCGIICTTRYVVDAGFCKLKCYNPKIGMDSLLVTPISQVWFYSAGRSVPLIVTPLLLPKTTSSASVSIALLRAAWVVYARLCLEVLAGPVHCYWRNAIRSDRMRSYPIRSDSV